MSDCANNGVCAYIYMYDACIHFCVKTRNLQQQKKTEQTKKGVLVQMIT